MVSDNISMLLVSSNNQGSLEDLDRKAFKMSIFDIPKWAHLYTLTNYCENYKESYLFDQFYYYQFIQKTFIINI